MLEPKRKDRVNISERTLYDFNNFSDIMGFYKQSYLHLQRICSEVKPLKTAIDWTKQQKFPGCYFTHAYDITGLLNHKCEA